MVRFAVGSASAVAWLVSPIALGLLLIVSLSCSAERETSRVIAIGEFAITPPPSCQWRVDDNGRKVRFTQISGQHWSVAVELMKPPTGMRIDVNGSIDMALKDLESLHATVSSVTRSRATPVVVDIRAANAKGIRGAMVWIHDVHTKGSTLSSIGVYRGKTPPEQIRKIFDSIQVSQ